MMTSNHFDGLCFMMAVLMPSFFGNYFVCFKVPYNIYLMLSVGIVTPMNLDRCIIPMIKDPKLFIQCEHLALLVA